MVWDDIFGRKKRLVRGVSTPLQPFTLDTIARPYAPLIDNVLIDNP